MADRLRSSRAALTAVLLVLVGALPATAAESWACWHVPAETGSGQTAGVTRCRLGGSQEVVDYGSGSEVPVRLSPAVGTDGAGTCWFWTTRSSDWVLLGVDDELVASLGIDPDGIPGGPVIIDVELPACTSEPSEVPTALVEAYELLSRYDHVAPDPIFDPRSGFGITGLETFLVAEPPPPWTASLVSPFTGRTIAVESRVAAIEIDWGDGTVETIPEEAFPLLTGWPDGAFGHAYETKTCDPPGAPGCHPAFDAYPVEVRYLWAASYRVDRGPSQPIPVPPTDTTVAYDVDEIRALTTGVG